MLVAIQVELILLPTAEAAVRTLNRVTIRRRVVVELLDQLLDLHSALQLERVLLLDCVGDAGEVGRVAFVDVCVGRHESLAILTLLRRRAVLESRAVDPNHDGLPDAAVKILLLLVFQ